MFLDVEGVCKGYGSLSVLGGISFTAAQGELVSIVGPSGAGKTTLLKILAGLEEADAGMVRCQADLERNPAILVFQDYLLFPTMTVFDNVAFGLRCRKAKKRMIGRRVADMLDYFQLGPKAQSYPAQLSAGQQQRVALARAMVVEPSLLLLDEPFANLDRNLKAETAEFIRSFQQEYTITTISVTHDLQEAFMMSDKIGIMLNGELCQFDTVESVYNRPVSRHVAGFLGHINIVPGYCLHDVDMQISEELKEKTIGVRAESIELHADASGSGVIADILFAGHFIIYRVQLHDIALRVYSFSCDHEVGDRVSIHIKHCIPMKEN